MEDSQRLTYDGYKAWIEVDERELQCYSTEVDNTKNTVTCWIASEAGKTFSIGCQPNESETLCRARIYLDGTRVTSTWWDENSRCSYHFRTLSTSDTTKAPFMFSNLELTDDDNYLEAPLTANLGEIKLVFESVTNPVWKESSSKSAKRRLPTIEKVHERSKKAMTHRINLGDERSRKKRSKSNREVYLTAQERLATFIFRYRPLDMLQANGIIPRIPDLVMSSQDSNPSTSRGEKTRKRESTHLKEDLKENIKNFEDRENALLAELSRLKDEKEKFLLAELEKLRKDKHSTNDSNTPRKKVKTEAKPYHLPGEVIDLT